MIIVHHLSDSRSQRILWLLEELELSYEIKHYERTPDQRAPKELLKINPLGKAPVIQDGNITLAESGAIIDYLIGRYGNGKFQVPASDHPGYIHNLYYSHYAEGSLMPLVAQKFIYDMVPTKSPLKMRSVITSMFSDLSTVMLAPEFEKHFTLLENHLASVKSGWFAGGDQPTAADFQMSFPLEGIVSAAPHMATPRMTAYVKQVHDRPAYKRALQQGGGKTLCSMSGNDLLAFLKIYYCGK